MPLLFALFCFAIAGLSFFVAFVALHIWLAATFLVRLCEGKYIQATLWLGLLAYLVSIDVR
jgi:hypothetical protein